MAVLGVSSITPAFPVMVEELNISTRSIGLLIAVFTLPGILLTPIFGVLADRFGRKRIIVPSLMLFGIAGGACGFARSFNLLLILRFFQGVGAASLGSLNITIIGDLYSGDERTSAMGYNAGVLNLGTASYPAIGGALAMLGWYYPFFLPFVAISLGILVLSLLKNPEPKSEQSIKEYLSNAWRSIKDSQVVVLLIAGFIAFIILYGPYLTYFPILIGRSFSASPLGIGLIMSVMSLTTAFVSLQLGKLARDYSKIALLKTAFVLYALALVIIPFIPSLWLMLIPVLIFGIAHGMSVPSIQTLLAELAPIQYRGAFMSGYGMALRLGQTLAPVFMGVIFAIWGIGGVFYLGACFSIAMFVVLVIMR